MRRYLVVAACATVAVLVGASTASAFIANPQAPGNWGTLTGCLSSGQVVVATGDQTFNSGDYLRLGWGTNTQAQSSNFLAAQSGTLSITGANGSQSWTWGVGDTDDWTTPVLMSAPGNTVNGGKPLWVTFTFLQVTLPPGTYTVSANFAVDRTVQDGSKQPIRPGSWFSTSGCTLTVA
jgi:hypothetical protein